MKRRKFIKDAAILSGVGLASTIPTFKINPYAFGATGESVVGVAKGTDWTALVAKSLEPLGGMKAFVKPGQKVVLKPNASFDRTPEQGSNTHPEIMKAVVQLCLEADPKEIIVVDCTLANERRCWTNSGIEAAINSLGDKRVTINKAKERDFTAVKIPKGVSIGKWKFFKPALEADSYINIPVAKHHSATKLTLGLKNMLGILGGARQKIHSSIEQGIADLHNVVYPQLTVIDATRILLRNGPSGGNIEDVEIKNTVISSADTVAADAYAAQTLFDMAPEKLGHVRITSEMGLGVMDLDKIKVVEA